MSKRLNVDSWNAPASPFEIQLLQVLVTGAGTVYLTHVDDPFDNVILIFRRFNDQKYFCVAKPGSFLTRFKRINISQAEYLIEDYLRLAYKITRVDAAEVHETWR